MKVSFDLYTKDLDKVLEAFRIGERQTDELRLHVYDGYGDKCLNIMGDIDHNSDLLEFMEQNGFKTDSDEL